MRAMLLCAGYGTRLGELTRAVPKPMLSLQERPMLEYIIAHLASNYINQIAINLHFLPEMIRDYFADGSRLKVELTYSDEPELMGTAGGVKKMEKFLRQDDCFLVQYGDIITDQDLTALHRFHLDRQALVTLLLHQRARSNSIVSLDDEGRVVRFLERPDESTRRGENSTWVNSGICICAPEFLDAIPSDLPCDLPRDIFPTLIPSGRIFGFPLSGYRCAVDSPERLAEARAALVDGRCRIPLA